MEFTLNNCISRINQALNYPALSYSDVYHFLDQAIYELNSSLRIALPTVTEMLHENTVAPHSQPNLVKIADNGVMEKDVAYDNGYASYAYLGGDKFAVTKNGATVEYDGLYGYRFSEENIPTDYVAVTVGDNAYWQEIKETSTDFDVTEYLPFDWWTLFIIPYTCSKWANRNGDDSSHFIDEYIQGYQQLQTSYNVPNRVKLSEVAGRKAYKKLVEERLPHLNAVVFTRAIYEDMKVGNGIMPSYGGFYETGGWGV